MFKIKDVTSFYCFTCIDFLERKASSFEKRGNTHWWNITSTRNTCWWNPHHFGNLNPDPLLHQSDKPNPDPHLDLHLIKNQDPDLHQKEIIIMYNLYNLWKNTLNYHLGQIHRDTKKQDTFQSEKLDPDPHLHQIKIRIYLVIVMQIRNTDCGNVPLVIW